MTIHSNLTVTGNEGVRQQIINGDCLTSLLCVIKNLDAVPHQISISTTENNKKKGTTRAPTIKNAINSNDGDMADFIGHVVTVLANLWYVSQKGE